MNAKFYKDKVVVASADTTVYEVAHLMKEHNIGDVVVVDNEQFPVGIITDRDIVIKVIADDVNLKEISAGDLIDQDLLVLREYQTTQEMLDMMCAKGVRRAPIIDDSGSLIDLVSLDDIILLISDQIESYAKIVRKQLMKRWK